MFNFKLFQIPNQKTFKKFIDFRLIRFSQKYLCLNLYQLFKSYWWVFLLNTYFSFNHFYFNSPRRVEINLLFIYFRNNIYSVKYFFGYPIGSRTRTNGKNAKKKNIFFKNIILKYLYLKFFSKQTIKEQFICLLVEFFNKVWFFQWYLEWSNAFQKVLSIQDIKYQKWRFGYKLLLLNRPITFSMSKSKKKINKKKQIIFKNIYNLGFLFGFANTNLLQIKPLKNRMPYLLCFIFYKF